MSRTPPFIRNRHFCYSLEQSTDEKWWRDLPSSIPRWAWVAVLVWSIILLSTLPVGLLYFSLAKSTDFDEVVRALKGRGQGPSLAAESIQETLQDHGRLSSAVRIGASRRGTSTGTSVYRRVQGAYLAWFQKDWKPSVLAVNRFDRDDVVLRYEIEVHSFTIFAVPYALLIGLFLYSCKKLKKSSP